MGPSRGEPSTGGRVPGDAATGLSPAFLALLDAEPLQGRVVLDVGTGHGRLALALAPRAGRVIGVDRDPAAVEAARSLAAAGEVANATFEVFDAEVEEYDRFAPDAVVAHLCMSDAIVARAGRALRPGAVLVFAALHADHWRETGRRSRFAYAEDRMRAALEASGFAVEHLSVERHVAEYASVAHALAAAVGLEERWKADGRWFRYIKFLEEGGRTLTRAHLNVRARRR